MKKTLLTVLSCLFIILTCTPISAYVEEKNCSNENQKIVETLLGDFYEGNVNNVEINYGEKTLDEKNIYYNDTYEMYLSNDYEGILEYNIMNDISIVKTGTPIQSVYSIATRPINKSVSKTYSIDQGNYFQYGTVTVTFTGSYKYHTGDEEITSLTASSSISMPSNFSKKNSTFSKSYTSTTITLTQKMDVVITTGTGTTNTSTNQKFTATINAN